MVLKRRREVQHVILAHERAGDSARDQHLYEAAGQHYKLAVDIPVIAESDRARIEEKLMDALFLGAHPETADFWIERVLARTSQDPEKTIELLLSKSVLLCSAKAQVQEGLLVLERAMQVAEKAGDMQLIKLTRVRISGVLLNLGQSERASQFLASVGEVDERDDVRIRRSYYVNRALAFAQCGDAAKAYDDFDRAVRAAQESDNAYTIVNIWRSYARWAVALGDMEDGKSYMERALFAARSNQFAWMIPEMCLSYASILAKFGQLRSAREYVLEAFSFEASAGVLKLTFAEIGIPIALSLKDENLLVQCAGSQVLARALQSGIPEETGSVAAAFAEMYAHRGRIRDARELLHQTLPRARIADQNWNFPIAVARHGFHRDIQEARSLLEDRAALPSGDVAEAFLALFDGFVAQRQKRTELMRAHAMEAIRRFESLHWYGYADRARSLLPDHRPLDESVQRLAPVMSQHLQLTVREHEVAELVLKGHTNRAIARKLSISERTVETHMSSIMNRLGIRSRYQLPEAMP